MKRKRPRRPTKAGFFLCVTCGKLVTSITQASPDTLRSQGRCPTCGERHETISQRYAA